jgi:hypothetical protein
MPGHVYRPADDRRALIEMATLRISLGCIGAVSLIAFAAALLILPRQKAQGQTNSQTKAQG